MEGGIASRVPGAALAYGWDSWKPVQITNLREVMDDLKVE